MNFAFFDAKPYEIFYFEKHAGSSGISFKYFDVRLTADTVNLAEGFDGICISKNDTLTSDVIDKLTEYGIKTVALRCSGFGNIDMKHAFGKIRVVRIPYYSPHSVAEHAAALLLASVKHISISPASCENLCSTAEEFNTPELFGKTVGIIGTGRVGRAFADICLGLGMRVLAYDKFKSEELCSRGRVKYTDLKELFSESDVISLHCPLKEETYHVINKSSLTLCKRGVIIINTSQAALIDYDALTEAMKDRLVGGVCLDIYEEGCERLSESGAHRLLKDTSFKSLLSLQNVTVTSHCGYLTNESLDAIAKTTVKNIIELLQSGKCKNELC